MGRRFGRQAVLSQNYWFFLPNQGPVVRDQPPIVATATTKNQ